MAHEMLLGRTVFIRTGLHTGYVGNIISITDQEGGAIIDSVLPDPLDICSRGYRVLTHIETRGYGVGQWQLPECLVAGPDGMPDYSMWDENGTPVEGGKSK